MIGAVAVAAIFPGNTAWAAPTYNNALAPLKAMFWEKCNVPAESGHPAVDLNGAKLSDDAMIPSKQHSSNEFAVQVCEILNFTDKVCTRGATVCEVDKSTKETLEVYGFIDTISTSWDSEALVMNMVGGDCKENPQSKLHTRIYFLCDKDAKAGEITLRDESQFGCYVEFEYKTVHACGAASTSTTPSSGTAKYKCDNGRCVDGGDTGVPKETCEQICTPSDTKWACVMGTNGPECRESGAGNHTSQPACEEKCVRTYKCEGYECTAVLDGSGTSLKECEDSCKKPTDPTYLCKQGVCEEQHDGAGVSKDVCEQICGAPPADKYKCEHNECIKAETGGITKEECAQICDPAPAGKYKCEHGACVKADEGGVDIDVCKQICGGSKPPFMLASL